MRETCLLLKVFLLLAAMVGSSGSYAASTGDHQLEIAIVDFNAVLVNQTCEDDERSAPNAVGFVSSVTPSAPAASYRPLRLSDSINKPFARAPPVKILV